MTRQSARGHICIRRKAKDGDPGKTGNPGLTIRTTAWETGKEYRNDTALDVSSVRYLDIVLDKPITVGVANINAYLCLKTHTSSASIPLGHTTYWQKMNSFAPIVTAMVLTELLKAQYIDVNDLAANSAFIEKLVATALFTTRLTTSEAFIKKLVASSGFIEELTVNNAFLENLKVKHLDAADGVFSGMMRLPFTQITSSLYTITNESPSAILIPESSRFSGNPYNGTTAIPKIVDLGSSWDVDGAILYICAPRSFFKATVGTVTIRKNSNGGLIYYGTDDHIGGPWTLKSAESIVFSNQAFISLIYISGNWYVQTIMGEHTID